MSQSTWGRTSRHAMEYRELRGNIRASRAVEGGGGATASSKGCSSQGVRGRTSTYSVGHRKPRVDVLVSRIVERSGGHACLRLLEGEHSNRLWAMGCLAATYRHQGRGSGYRTSSGDAYPSVLGAEHSDTPRSKGSRTCRDSVGHRRPRVDVLVSGTMEGSGEL